MLTLEQAEHWLIYEADTGRLVWKETARGGGHVKAGEEAGCIRDNAYRVVRINGRLYRAHRIAWLMAYGDWPAGNIDHINGDGLDNRVDNLRIASHAENGRNSKLPANNTSGSVGVQWRADINKWIAQIKVDYKTIYLGSFTDWWDAICARKDAEFDYGFHINHGRQNA